MVFFWITTILSFVIGLAIAAPSPSIESDACEKVASTFVNITANRPPMPYGEYSTINAGDAYSCLKSVPFNATFALEWVESLRPYLQWQSTTAYLKEPPEGYWQGPHDLIGALDLITLRINNESYYHDEYDFEMDLFHMFHAAHDGHLRYFPKIFSGIFSWVRPVSIVSISVDGITAPRAYVYSDILLSLNSTFVPSPIDKMYDISAQDALAVASYWTPSLDQDAAYNQLMMSLAQQTLGLVGNGAGVFAGGGRGAVQFPGLETRLEFENGTTRVYQNLARVLQDFTNVTSGAILREKFLRDDAGGFTISENVQQVGTTGTDSDLPPHPDADPKATYPGYPEPVVSIAFGFMGGYYLHGATAYEDTAVLAMATFGTNGNPGFYVDAVQKFIAQAKQEGKRKLIIDLSANGGGDISLAYLLFYVLFPDLEAYGGHRFRAHEDFDILGQLVSDAVGTDYPWRDLYPPGPGMILEDFIATPFIAPADMSSEGQPFKSWAEKFGPHEFHGDQFTSVMRWNNSDPAMLRYTGLKPSDFTNLTQPSRTRPFATEDIIVLTDGYCASTCSLFVEFLTQQAGVKTVAVGGRSASPVGPMQAVGGVRGANVYQWYSISSFAAEAQALANGTSREGVANEMFSKYSTKPMARAADYGGRVNVRDNIRKGDAEQTPTQFIYEKADCRIFYEKEHVVDVTTLWKSVYDVVWGGAQCAEGGVSTSRLSNRVPSSGRKPHQMRVMHHDELEQLRNAWRVGYDVNKIQPMAGFQLP